MNQIMWALKDKESGKVVSVYSSRSIAREMRWSPETIVKVEVKEVKEKK